MTFGGRVALLLGPPIVAALVRLAATTLRVRTAGIEPLVPLWEARRPLIYAVWHGRLLMMPWANAWLGRRHGARLARVLASRSRDGDLVARYVEWFGLGVVRGSSSRGGAVALRELAATLGRGGDVALVPDGPRGPRGRLQPGVVALAMRTGAPVIPIAFAARPSVTLASWDRFQVPLPFARCAAVFGAPAFVPPTADREHVRRDLEARLNDVTATADRLVRAS